MNFLTLKKRARSMKKNLLLGLMALIGLFTSCSQDDVSSLPTDQSNSNAVSIGVEMPADFVKTRAAGMPTAPAGHKLRCILEVWTSDGATKKLRKEQVYTSGNEMTFTFELADLDEYKAVLWADYIDENRAETDGTYADKYYKTNDTNQNGLKKVSIIENAYTYAEDVREAFTGTVTFTKELTALEIPKVTLTRPLTKITIAEKKATNVALCKSMTATYTVPSELNPFTGTIGSATYNATYNAAPNGQDLIVGGNTYKTLFTDYVFTVSDGTMGEIALTFTDQKDGTTLNPKTIPAGMSLKRNYWVRSAGELITLNYDANTSLTVDMTTDWTSQDEEVAIAVGDFYLSDGTIISKDSELTQEQKAACVGVVLKVGRDVKDDSEYKLKGTETPMQIKGYVLALYDVNDGKWCVWCPIDEATAEIGVQADATDFSGYKNTQTIIEYAKNNGKTLQKNFPATYYATTYYESEHAAPANTSGWFFPASGQCQYWLNNNEELLKSVKKATDKSDYSWKGYYSSSTEANNSNIWLLDYEQNKKVIGDGKQNDSSVRSVLAF